MATPSSLTCRFCGFRVLYNYTSKGGKFIHQNKAYDRLTRHALEMHADEPDMLQLIRERDELDTCSKCGTEHWVGGVCPKCLKEARA